ncbi:type II toxin-antitoxin system HicB family antitoxin [Cupriavidus sp. KB_39]|uniref:type II toxin-antitoxin system HicB family antitoxin n=1 Tax=Cupriavidus sp. KB_39 TaxID=3233036 RepID=UPI003F91FE8A
MPSDHYTYRVTWSGEDEEYLGLCAEFPSLSWLAESQVDALDGVRQLVADAVRDISTSGEKLPMALADQKYSDKFQVRIPPEQHRALAIEAAEQGVSLNRLISARLAVATR